MDLVYRPIIGLALAVFQGLGLRFTVSGSEHVPTTGGAVMALNHIGYLDFTFAGLAARPAGRLVRQFLLVVASALALAFVAMVSVTSFVVVRSRPTTTAAARASDAQPSEAASTPSTPAKCCPGESEIACQMRISAGAACGGESPRTSPQAFDRPAAARALGISVSSCKRTDGPTGAGHVKVTFQPSGSVSAVEVEAPYAGTATGACIAQRYRGATVPAFTGGPLAVGKTFAIE